MQRDTLFRIYSMTKAITTTAAMQLWEAGKFQRGDPVREYLPELTNIKLLNGKAPKRAMTIRDLMRHTSGLTYAFLGDALAEDYRSARVGALEKTLSQSVAALATLPILHEPGTKFNYSVSTDVLGRVVEVISGKTLDAYFDEAIFKPLRMVDTGFYVPTEKRGRFAATHSTNSEGKLIVTDSPSSSPYLTMPKNLSGGGGLVSTATDYFRFCQAILNGGTLDGERILNSDTVDLMTQNHIPPSAMAIGVGDTRPGFGFGLGFNIRTETTSYDPDAPVGEFGWGGAASTHYWMHREKQLLVITKRQFVPYEWTLERELKGLIYDAIED